MKSVLILGIESSEMSELLASHVTRPKTRSSERAKKQPLQKSFYRKFYRSHYPANSVDNLNYIF